MRTFHIRFASLAHPCNIVRAPALFATHVHPRPFFPHRLSRLPQSSLTRPRIGGPGLARESSRIRRGCSGRLRTVGHGRHLAIQIRKCFIRYPDYSYETRLWRWRACEVGGAGAEVATQRV